MGTKKSMNNYRGYLKWATLVVAIFGVTGCVRYVPPPFGPSATIAGENYSIFQDARTCTETLDTPNDHPNKIKAGEMSTFIVKLPESKGTCPPVVFSFTPKANNQYQICYTYVQNTLTQAPDCHFSLMNVTNNKLAPFVIRDYHVTPILMTPRYCLDHLSTSKR